MKSVQKVIYTGVLLSFVLGASFSANAQKQDQRLDEWNFRISPYFWFVSFKGTIYKPPVPIIPGQLPEPIPRYDIDISFKEVAAHLKFAIMAAGEYRHKRFVTQFNIASVIIDGDAVTPGDLILQDAFLHFGYVSGDLTAGHHFIFNNKLEIAGMAGLKFIYFDIKGSASLVGTVDFAGERDFLWLDPILGTRIKYKPHKRIELVTYSDIGGFLFGDELNYQFIGTANYMVSKWFLFSVGYRLLGLKVDESEALYNGKIKGLVIRVGFQF
jgi:hypothetical protein